MIKHLVSFLLIAFTLSLNAQNNSVSIMSFNMRYDNANDGINRWDNRREWITDYLNFTTPDIIGTQELLHHQLQWLDNSLPKYKYVGVGRDDGKEDGEYAAILYNKNLYDLLESNTFWLSATPDKVGSRGWDAACNRVVTWAHLSSKKTEHTFYVFNVHFDHRGEVARQKSVELILEKLPEITQGKTAFLLGDFNANCETAVYTQLEGSDYLQDTRLIAKKYYGPSWTFNGFGSSERDNNRIDHIFVSEGGEVKVQKHIIAAERRQDQFISDHYPVMVQVKF